METNKVSDTDALIAHINAERGARGWSVAKLAQVSGVTVGTLNRRLSSEPRSMRLQEIQKIAGAFGMAASEFIAGAEARRLVMEKELSQTTETA